MHQASVRVEGTPGRTQELIFFSLGGGRLTLVDMPGYGYAAVARGKKLVWQKVMADYLEVRGALNAPGFEAARFVLFSARASVGGGPYVVEAVYPLH